MSATNELRRMLDERGVKWWPMKDELDGYCEDRDTGFIFFGCEHVAHEWGCRLQVDMLTPGQVIDATLGPQITGDTSDGYHTFNELYHHRAVLFSVIVRDHPEIAWKAKKHHDGTMYDGMFIVGIDTPQGQATYHYDIDPYWEMFDCKELDRAPEWDGHTSDDAIARIATLGCDEPPYERLIERLREDWDIDVSWDGLRRFWHIQLIKKGERERISEKVMAIVDEMKNVGASSLTTHQLLRFFANELEMVVKQ